MNADSPAEIFGKPIYTYSRRQALEDGFQIDISATAREAGFRWPMFINRTVWEAYVSVPEGMRGQDEAGRLWDIVSMFRCAAGKGGEVCLFKLHVRNDNRHPKVVTLKAQCGPKDIDDQAPAITIMLLDED